jgi:hypothetical protein
MASAYSQDLRDGVIDAVVRDGMSRRAAAARFGVSEASPPSSGCSGLSAAARARRAGWADTCVRSFRRIVSFLRR